GAFVQGMGWLTTEELWWDAEGRLRTHGPSTYKIPGSRDVPPIFNTRLLEDAPNRAATIFRSKAIGEPPLMLAISVWLAIRDAIPGPPRPSAGASPRRAGHARTRAGRDRGHAGAHEALAGKNRRVLLPPADSLHPPHSALYTLLRRQSPSASVVLPCSRSFR